MSCTIESLDIIVFINYVHQYYLYEHGNYYTLVNKRKVYFGLLADIGVFLLQPNIGGMEIFGHQFCIY